MFKRALSFLNKKVHNLQKKARICEIIFAKPVFISDSHTFKGIFMYI